jgi:uncharacterized protein YndB with AHSA1/START domain
MEFGVIEREIYIDASPDVVFEVVSKPEHVAQWWPDEAAYEVTPGAGGTITFGKDTVEQLTVVEVQPPSRFQFRWTHPAGTVAAAGNSLLVTFELSASGGGTLLRMTETGFREMGWEVAVLEERFNDHVSGWSFFLPRLAPYLKTLGVRQ